VKTEIMLEMVGKNPAHPTWLKAFKTNNKGNTHSSSELGLPFYQCKLAIAKS